MKNSVGNYFWERIHKARAKLVSKIPKDRKTFTRSMQQKLWIWLKKTATDYIQPSKKKRRKRKIPLVTIACILFFLTINGISFIYRSSAEAAKTITTQASSSVQSLNVAAPPQSVANRADPKIKKGPDKKDIYYCDAGYTLREGVDVAKKRIPVCLDNINPVNIPADDNCPLPYDKVTPRGGSRACVTYVLKDNHVPNATPDPTTTTTPGQLGTLKIIGQGNDAIYACDPGYILRSGSNENGGGGLFCLQDPPGTATINNPNNTPCPVPYILDLRNHRCFTNPPPDDIHVIPLTDQLAYNSGVTTNNNGKNPVPTPPNPNDPHHGKWVCPSGWTYQYQGRGGTIESQSCAKNDWVFPCADATGGGLNEANMQNDWLSGNVSTDDGNSQTVNSGHFLRTYSSDTYAQSNVMTLFSYMEGVAFLLLGPSIILVGYQIMLAASGFRYAGALETLSRVIISVIVVAACYSLITFLISTANSICDGIVALHKALPYPTGKGLDGYDFGYNLVLKGVGEGDPASYRGLVQPVNRWGCTANDFVGLLANQLVGDTMAAIIPVVGNFVKLTNTIFTMVDFAHHVGEFVVTVLSISLTVQVCLRIILLNFYIVTAPPAFACWGLPGGVGQNIIKQWMKGFSSMLVVQIIQLFVLTVAPLIIPPVNDLPNIPLDLDSLHILSSIVPQIPAILVLIMVLRIPTMLGTSAAKSIASAGTLAGGTVSAIGMSLHSMV